MELQDLVDGTSFLSVYPLSKLTFVFQGRLAGVCVGCTEMSHMWCTKNNLDLDSNAFVGPWVDVTGNPEARGRGSPF